MRSPFASLASLASFVSFVTVGSAFVAAVALAPLGGCIAISTGSGDAGTAAVADAATVTTADGAVTVVGVTAAQGADCITDTATGLQICSAISLCPNVVVDHDVYPDCGWRINGQAMDLECACDTMICAIGAPTTCDQAAKLLADQTQAGVCQQVNEDRCTAGAATGSSSSSSSGTSGTTSTCDKTCAGECANDPSCLRLCGC